MPIVLALVTSLLWGTADYGGGLLSRRLPATLVVGASQVVALAVLILAICGASVAGAAPPFGWYLLYGSAAGMIGTVAMFAFYRALAAGPMGLISPLSATGVAVPVAVGALHGERLGSHHVGGIALAACGAVLASGSSERCSSSIPVHRRTIVLAVAAALGIGAELPLLAHGGHTSVLGTLVMQRATQVGTMGAVVLFARQRVRIPARNWPPLAGLGLAEIVADSTYIVATTSGLLSVVSVLASLYPVITALLAWRLLGERLRLIQSVGVTAALTGVALLAV